MIVLRDGSPDIDYEKQDDGHDVNWPLAIDFRQGIGDEYNQADCKDEPCC